MTQEDKNILLKDLCARLPYNTNIQVKDWAVLDAELEIGHINRLQNDDLELKPYLRPMSSLIEKELEECRATCKYRKVGQSVLDCATPETIDYLISHYFDYRGLIPMGLALEAPEGMYKTE